MEAPTCRLCHERHWSHEPHRFAGDDAPLEVAKRMAVQKVVPKPKVLKKIGAKVPQRMTEKERERIVEQEDGTAVFVREAAKKTLAKADVQVWRDEEAMVQAALAAAGKVPGASVWDDCPRCAERLAKDAERAKKYRERKGKQA